VLYFTTQSVPNYIATDVRRMKKLKLLGRKQLWPNQSTRSEFALRGCGKSRKMSLRIAGIPAGEITFDYVSKILVICQLAGYYRMLLRSLRIRTH
jgi:hypothetical protein